MTTPPIDDGAGTTDVSRRLLVVTAAGVGVGALLLGWAVGRGADSNDAATPTPVPTTAAPTTTERITDTIAPPVTTARPRPSTTTTTTLPAGTPVDVLMSPELRAMPYELAVTDYSGSVYRIDLPAGTMRSYPGRRSQPPFVSFRPDGSLLTYSPWGDGSAPNTVTLDGVVTRFEPVRNVQLIVDGVGDAWHVSYDSRALQLLDDQLQPVGEPVATMPDLRTLADPAGGVLVSGSIGTFSHSPSGGTRRLTSGDVVAIGVDTFVAYECNDDFVCGHVVVDRLTGERTTIDLEALVRSAPAPTASLALEPDPVGATRRIVPPGWYGATNTPTVVGQFAVLGVETVDDDAQLRSMSFVVVDLERAAVTAHVAAGYTSGIALSPDGRVGFVPIEGESTVVVIDLATGAPTEFELPNAAQGFGIAIRVI